MRSSRTLPGSRQDLETTSLYQLRRLKAAFCCIASCFFAIQWLLGCPKAGILWRAPERVLAEDRGRNRQRGAENQNLAFTSSLFGVKSSTDCGSPHLNNSGHSALRPLDPPRSETSTSRCTLLVAPANLQRGRWCVGLQKNSLEILLQMSKPDMPVSSQGTRRDLTGKDVDDCFLLCCC